MKKPPTIDSQQPGPNTKAKNNEQDKKAEEARRLTLQ